MSKKSTPTLVDQDKPFPDPDDNQLKAWTVSFTYYEYDGYNSSGAKFHRQIMYARSEDSIREQIENFMPFYNDLKPTDILIGAPTKL